MPKLWPGNLDGAAKEIPSPGRRGCMAGPWKECAKRDGNTLQDAYIFITAG